MSTFNYTISSSWNPNSENSLTKIDATADGEKIVPVSITGYWIMPKLSAYQAKTNLNATSFRFTCNAHTDFAGALYLKDLSVTEPQNAFSLNFRSNKEGTVAPYNIAFSNNELGYIQWSSSVDDVFYRTESTEAGSLSATSSTRYPIDTCELNIDVSCMPVFTDEASMNLYLSDPNNVEYQKLASNYLPPPQKSVSSEMLIEEYQLLARRRMLMAKKNEKFRKQYNLALLGKDYWSRASGSHGYGETLDNYTYDSVTYSDGTSRSNVPAIEFGDFGIKTVSMYGPFCNTWVYLKTPPNIKRIIVNYHSENTSGGYSTWISCGSLNGTIDTNFYSKPSSDGIDYSKYGCLLFEHFSSHDGIINVEISSEQTEAYNSYSGKYFHMETCGGYIWLKELYIQLTDGSYWTPQ